MAIKFQEVYKQVYETPLSEEEIKQVDRVEKWIDEEVRKIYRGGTKVSINLRIANFEYDPITKDSFAHQNFPSPRKQLMRKELDRRYKNAGWEIEIEIDDGLDGPRSGPDYWVLVGTIPQPPRLSSE